MFLFIIWNFPVCPLSLGLSSWQGISLLFKSYEFLQANFESIGGKLLLLNSWWVRIIDSATDSIIFYLEMLPLPLHNYTAVIYGSCGVIIQIPEHEWVTLCRLDQYWTMKTLEKDENQSWKNKLTHDRLKRINIVILDRSKEKIDRMWLFYSYYGF